MSSTLQFSQLGLSPELLQALNSLGYEAPTPVQSHTIPYLLQGDDLLAQAQTGTGKTAAFALPILANVDVSLAQPQALILAPTRELAIQVAEAFQSYAQQIKGFQVTPIYGGQDYPTQLRALKRGAHVIVGTPGRVMDHLERGTLSLKSLQTIVLDEADEMLKMGFIEDVEWILQQIPHQHQTALFSATIPDSIRKIAQRYLKNPRKVHIKPKEKTVNAIEQSFIRLANKHKLMTLVKYLEVEETQGVMIFTRTKNGSSDVAEILQRSGYHAAALNGDMNQALRKKVVERMKSGSLDIVVATDVAARGIDIERVSHVINFDIPYDTESYIHRIGRTGRAGRKGKSLLFVTPREERLLKDIERAVHASIQEIKPPSREDVAESRTQRLSENVVNVLQKSKHLEPYQEMVEKLIHQHDLAPEDIAAALAYLMQGPTTVPQAVEISPEPEQRRRRPRRSEKRPERSRSYKGKSAAKKPRSKTGSKAGSKPSSKAGAKKKKSRKKTKR